MIWQEGEATEVPRRKFGHGVWQPLQSKDFQNGLDHMSSWIIFYNNTYELAHLDRDKYRTINHDKLKHFHSG